MTTRPVPTDRARRPAPRHNAPRRDAVPARTAAAVLALATLLIVALTAVVLRTPVPVAAAAPGGDVYLSGAIMTQLVTPDNAGAVRDGRFEFVHEAPPYPLRIRADLPASGSDYIADGALSVDLLGPDGAPLRSFTAPVGSVAATSDEIVLNGRLFDERGETLWLAARFAR